MTMRGTQNFACVLLAMLFCCCEIQFSRGQGVRTESVKVAFCRKAYEDTSFSQPNLFQHKTQDEAIAHMHTFSPLIATFCHRNTVFFTCLVHFPSYLIEPDRPAVNQPACRSLCEDVFNGCKYAMDRINFHWPNEISCEKFNDTACVFRDDPKSRSLAPAPTGCANVAYHGGTPICSAVTDLDTNTKYFTHVNLSFTNYFNHPTQEQAIYELSRHGRLVQLLISQQPDLNSTNVVTQCLNDIRFLLCNLYLPRCGDTRPADYPITKTACQNTLGKNCSSAILQLRNRGYNVTWPPVDVDCVMFSDNLSPGNNITFKKERSFGGLSAPPPAIEVASIGGDFLEIKWNEFPEAYKLGTTVETGILYRKSGERLQFKHQHTPNNKYVFSGLNVSTAYEMYVGTVNNISQFPGVMERIEVRTVKGVERIQIPFCSSLYNFTKFPNIFGHQTQDEARYAMHIFTPLLYTGCSSNLRALMCAAYLPNYLAKEQVTLMPCQSLCKSVSTTCSYAINQLKFKWPNELQCDKLQGQSSSCDPPPTTPTTGAGKSDTCEAVEEQSICSRIRDPSGFYFTTVYKVFKNYLNHSSQQQAVYELGKHVKLLSMINALTTFGEGGSDEHNNCKQKLTYLLCALHLPNCRAGIEISRNECEQTLGNPQQPQTFYECARTVIALRGHGYTFDWPPVQVDCKSINASVGTPKYSYREFEYNLPPPPGLTYRTIGQRMELTWNRQRPLVATNELEILFKPLDVLESYSHTHVPQANTTINLAIDTNKDYDIFVAYLRPNDRIPGHFERIIYIKGSSVVALPVDLGPCQSLYQQSVFPNMLGDKNISEAKSRMTPFFPLIYTLCSENLISFLCSTFFPRYHFAQQLPCKTTCVEITTSCSYAVARSKFSWPSELKCERFKNNERCFDVTIPRSKNPPPGQSDEREVRRRRSAEEECKPTTTAMCLAVIPRSSNTDSMSRFASTFSSGQRNYFNHDSTDEAIYELSKHLRLLSTLREYSANQGNADAGKCFPDLLALLCHLYLPACPAVLFSQDHCLELLNVTAPCYKAVKKFNDDGHDLQWPPVHVNCRDTAWFTANATVDGFKIGPVETLASLPPPTNIEISGQTLNVISVKFRSLVQRGNSRRRGAVLYRRNNSVATYSFQQQKELLVQSIDVQKLSPGTAYELKVATLDGRTQFPGVFRTITSRTYDSGVLDIPASIDICYSFYRKTLLPNMYGDKTLGSAKQRFLPFYPLVHTSCSSELTAFLCSLFIPRYNPVTYSSQRPCRRDCQRVYDRCSYAILRSRFFWPDELKCSEFQDDSTCYNLTKTEDVQDDLGGQNGGGNLEPARRRRRAAAPQCKTTPSTRICSRIIKPLESPVPVTLDYFNSTLDRFSNYFNHNTTDEAVYELSLYLNLLSTLRWNQNIAANRRCHAALSFLLCHLHLPVCPRTRISDTTCLQATGNGSDCFNAIQDLNKNGANFTWPPVQADCRDDRWFRSDTEDTYDFRRNSELGPPAPDSIRTTSQSSDHLRIQYQRPPRVVNTTALYRRRGAIEPYQYTPPSVSFLLLSQLTPATDYEIHLASLDTISGFPGAFVGITSNTYGQCENDTTGEDIAQGKFSWKVQSGDSLQTHDCPYGLVASEKNNASLGSLDDGSSLDDLLDDLLDDGSASRFCKCDDNNICKNPFWLEPITTPCEFKVVNNSNVTSSLSEVFQMLSGDGISPQNASERLVNITSEAAEEFKKDDVILTTLILENIVSDTKNLNQTGANIVKSVDNLLNAGTESISESQRESNASARIIVVLEQYFDNVPLKSGESVSQNERNIAFHTQQYNPKDFQGASAASVPEDDKESDNFTVIDKKPSVQLPNGLQVSITMPPSLFQNLSNETKSQDQRISFTVYRKTSFFILDKNEKDSKAKTIRRKNSLVISGSVKGQKLSNLADPIVTRYRPLEEGIDETTACVFWNFTGSDGSGDWSPVGCTYQGTVDGIVTCHCTHLTNFAILMDVHIDDRDESHDEALSIISYVGCAISLVGLVLTMITILIFKDLRRKVPTQILFNFCLALSLTLIVFLAGAERSRTSSLAGCRAAAIALHYFVLAMFVWTGVQAYNMYLNFVQVMPSYRSKFILKCCAVGWGVPALVVIITAAVAIEEYGDEKFCRVKGLPFQIGFLAPVVIILFLNSIAFVLIIRSLLTSGTKVTADKRTSGLQQARRGAAILVVLGLTWLFGVLAIRDAQLVFQYLFCIFNSIQGLLVFIFYCVLSADTKAKYKKLFYGKTRKNRYQDSSSEGRFHEVRSKDINTTSSGTASALSSPNHGASVELRKI